MMCILFVFGGQNDDEIIKMDSHFRYLLILRFIAVLIFVTSSSCCFIVVLLLFPVAISMMRENLQKCLI
jgi:hypothetical protein